MYGLLLQVKPHADESLLGYLCRLAEANAIEVTTVFDLLKENNGDRSDLHAMMGHENISWTGVAAELQNPQTRPAPLWNIRRRRFCRKCLEEVPYWRAEWDLSLVTACCRHRLQLQDACPHCAEALRWNGRSATCCSACGQSLVSGTASVIAADRYELWISKELTRRMVGSLRHCDRQLKHLGLEEFHDLAFRLGCFVSHPMTKKPKKVADFGSLVTVRPVAQATAQTLDNWPNGFFKSLDRIRAARSAFSEWRLSAAIGPIYREIFVGLSSSKNQFVRDAFDLYLSTNWQAPLALRNRRLKETAVQAHRWIPIHEAAARLRLDPSLVSRLVEAHDVPSREHQYPSGRTGRIVDVFSLERIAPALQRLLTVEEAAQALGLTKQRIGQLTHAGLLKVWGGKPRQGMRWRIDQASIQAILGHAANVPSVEDIADGRTTFKDLLRYRINGAGQFTQIVTHLMNSEGVVVGKFGGAERMSEWVIDVQALERGLKLKSLDENSELTVVQASNELGIKQEVAYVLIQYGLLTSRSIVVGKRSRQVVRYSAVAAFRHKYALGPEMAAMMGTSPKALLEYLRDRGIHPVVGPTVAGQPCRQYVWRRTKKLTALMHRAQGQHL